MHKKVDNMYDFVAISAPYILIAVAFVGLVFLSFRKIWTGLIILLCAWAYNYHMECIPLNIFSYYASSWSDNGDSRQERFRILTYNMYSASDYYRSVKEDPRDLYGFLIAQDADVIVLEEYYPDLCTALRDSLLQHYPYLEYQKFHCSNAVYSRYPLSNWHEMEVKLEENALDKYKFAKAKDLDNLRRMEPFRYNASVTVNLPNDSIRLITCHMASNHYDQIREIQCDTVSYKTRIKTHIKCVVAGNLEREVEARYVLEEVKDYREKKVKTIVLGDMNSVAGSSPLKILRQGDLLRNAWWEKGFGLGLTFHNHRVMYFRLDHVLYSRDLTLKKIRVADVDYSDHKPVIADFVCP